MEGKTLVKVHPGKKKTRAFDVSSLIPALAKESDHC